MNDRERLDQLRALLDQLERMPASASRDRTLAEVRARVVDVETGTPPTPMRAAPKDELKAETAAAQASRPAPAPRAKPRRAPRAKRVHPAARIPPEPVREPAREEVVDLLEQDGTLSLDEPPTAPSGPDRPWSGGLRG